MGGLHAAFVVLQKYSRTRKRPKLTLEGPELLDDFLRRSFRRLRSGKLVIIVRVGAFVLILIDEGSEEGKFIFARRLVEHGYRHIIVGKRINLRGIFSGIVIAVGVRSAEKFLILGRSRSCVFSDIDEQNRHARAELDFDIGKEGVAVRGRTDAVIALVKLKTFGSVLHLRHEVAGDGIISRKRIDVFAERNGLTRHIRVIHFKDGIFVGRTELESKRGEFRLISRFGNNPPVLVCGKGKAVFGSFSRLILSVYHSRPGLAVGGRDINRRRFVVFQLKHDRL